jgi:hypothetical protein
MAKDDDILRDAIIGTEKEVFGDAFDKEELTLDETGDRSIEAMGEGLEGQREPEDEDEAGESTEASEAKPEGEEAAAAETTETTTEVAAEAAHEAHGRVPSGRLREEAEKTRAAQAERDALKAQLEAEKTASQRAIAELNAKFEGFIASQRQTPQPKPEETKPEATPDLFEDPTAFVNHLQKGFDAKLAAVNQQIKDQRINISMELSRTRHGATFDAAFGALKSLDANNPDNRQLVQRLIDAPNPGEAVVTWHKRNEALREVGDDPTAYKAKIAEDTRKALMADPEFRKQLVAELRGEAMTGDNGRPRTTVKLPASLNRAGGNNTRAPNDMEMFDGSESATFNSAWTT